MRESSTCGFIKFRRGCSCWEDEGRWGRMCVCLTDVFLEAEMESGIAVL